MFAFTVTAVLTYLYTRGTTPAALMEVDIHISSINVLVPQCYENCTQDGGECVCDSDNNCHCECAYGRFGPSCEWGK
jgi:hypothetical protein